MEDTGLRITELLHVTLADIDLNHRILVVTHPKTEEKCKCSVWRYQDLYSRKKVLEKANPDCSKCHGRGKYKKPQRTTITPRIIPDLELYTATLSKNNVLFDAHRKTFWEWGKSAGRQAGINIFTQKEEKLIEGIYNHLFRSLCSKRMESDTIGERYRDPLIAKKLRHSDRFMLDRYTKIDINYLLAWEAKKYG